MSTVEETPVTLPQADAAEAPNGAAEVTDAEKAPVEGVVEGGAEGAADSPFVSASLYVGDLAVDTTEAHLFEVFNAAAPVASIRVCRNAITRQSLGYAYVNFHSAADAERVLDTMNYTHIRTRSCRIMWSHRNPNLRKGGQGNIFIKNLDKSIDNKQLHDTFSIFGNILSCKVARDVAGESRCFGFVHYETREAADEAIKRVNGMNIQDKEVYVAHFQKHSERHNVNEWTNCYVKNIPKSMDLEKLQLFFEQEADALVTSAVIRKDDEDKSLGFGFVNFADHEMAARAVETLNGKDMGERPAEEIKAAKAAKAAKKEAAKVEKAKAAAEKAEAGGDDKGEEDKDDADAEKKADAEEEEEDDAETARLILYVGRAQRKTEREKELRDKFEKDRVDRLNRIQGLNLYVKNISDDIDDQTLRKRFSEIGTVTSAKIMADPVTEKSRGFGFVCFSTPEEAAKAVTEMNGVMIGKKPLYVAMAQPKYVRRAHLRMQFGSGGQGGRGRQGPGGPRMPNQRNPNMMGQGGMYGFMPPHMMHPQGMMPQGMMQPGMMGPGRGQMMQGPGGPMMPGMPGQGHPGFPFMQQFPYGSQQQMHQQRQQDFRGQRGPGGRRGRGNRQGGRQQHPGQQQQQRQMQYGRGQQGGPQQPPQPTPMPMPQPVQAAQQQPVVQQRPAAKAPPQLTTAILANATPENQKNLLGEHLYPLILAQRPDLAPKITGMLLEALTSFDLLGLLEDGPKLRLKVDEAVKVLAENSQTA